MLTAILTGKILSIEHTRLTQTSPLAAHESLAQAYFQLDHSGADHELIRLAKACLTTEHTQQPADGKVIAAQIAHYRHTVEVRLRQAESERLATQTLQLEKRKRRLLVQTAVA